MCGIAVVNLEAGLRVTHDDLHSVVVNMLS